MRYIVGLDLGGTNLRIGLFDYKIQLLNKRILSTPDFRDKDSLIEIMVQSIKEIIKDNSIKERNTLGIGVGLPGPLDYKRQLVYFLPNIKGWHNVFLGKILKERIGINTIIDNDANLICLAEYYIGLARKYSNLVCITLGTGVGGGLIIENRLYRGTNSLAGEIGHIPITQDGPYCGCGKKGCLESYIGNQRIIRQAKKIFKKNITLEELSRLARLNDIRAIKIWKSVGEKLGTVLAGVINLLNPEAVVIAGGVSKAGKVLFDSIKETIKERAMPIQAKQVKILNSRLKDNAGITGAALLVKMEARNVNFYRFS
jgi:glucokinase